MDDQLDFGKDIVLTTSDEDEDSGPEDAAAERRRRFCIERKQMGPANFGGGALRQPKRSRDEYDRISSSNKRRRMVSSEQRHQPMQVNPLVVGSHFTSPSAVRSPANLEEKQQQQQQQPRGPVIYINPKFIKKFIEKSIKLASNNNSQVKQQQPSQQQKPTATTTTAAATTTNASSTATSMIEEIDFKTTSRDSLKAASTMAIVRIVTECIEDAGKRDEKLNKFLVSRLIYTLIQPEETTNSSGRSSNSMNRNHESAISTGSGSASLSTGQLGQAIPVIGGSVNQFNTCLLGVDGVPYLRPKRYQDSRKNKLKNHS